MTQRLFAGIVLAVVLSTGAAGAAPKPLKPIPTLAPVSAEATAQDARVGKLLPTATREKAEASGKSFASSSLEKMTEAEVLAAARANAAKLVTAKDADVTALAFIVLMQAAKSAHEDLKAIMEGVKKVNAEREAVEAAMAKLSPTVKSLKKSPPPAYLKKLTSAKTPNLKLAYTVLPAGSAAICESKADDLCLDELRQKLDSLSELSEMDMLRLQMLMDRRAKVLSTISNIMKKVSDTANSIIQNLK